MILLAAALLPPFYLFYKIYTKDRIEPESSGLIVRLFLAGALTTIAASVLELAGTFILDRLGLNPYGTLYLLIDNFIVIACAEEGVKRFALKKLTWKNPEFNFLFDGVVYGAAVSLGFAAAENIMYVTGFGGLGTAFIRAFTAIPLHCITGIYMGHFYGMAKYAENSRNPAAMKVYMKQSLLLPVLLHGLYDFLASMESDFATLAFYAVVIVIEVVALRQLNTYAVQDTNIEEKDQPWS
jgi:RsiW-degrading membrane proteinase PrsW (M82 family)